KRHPRYAWAVSYFVVGVWRCLCSGRLQFHAIFLYLPFGAEGNNQTTFMNLLKTSSLVLLISLCVFACKPDDEPKPNNSSNTGNNPSQNNPTTNNQTNNGTNDTIYDPNDNNKVIGYPLPLSDSCKIIVEVTNGFDIT